MLNANKLLTLAIAGALAACYTYYSAVAEVELPAVQLDETTPLREYRVTVCYEGEGDPEVDLTVEAWVSNASPSKVILIGEDELSTQRQNPTTGLYDNLRVDEACNQGWIVAFALAAGDTAAAEVGWKLTGTASSNSDEKVEDGRVSMKIEKL